MIWFFVFTIYRTLLSHILFYADSHHLFFYDSRYMADTLRREGLGGLLVDFIVQFMHGKNMGASTVATMLSVTYASLSIILLRLSDRFPVGVAGKSCLLAGIIQLPLLAAMALFFSFQRSTQTPLLIFVAFLVSLACLAVIRPRPVAACRKPVLTSLISLVIAAGCLTYTGVLFRKHYNIPERMMLKTEQFAEEGDWESVLEYSQTYFRAGRDNRLISYYRSLALAHTGRLASAAARARSGSNDPGDSYLMRLGQKALFFPWESNSRECEFGSLVYESTGLINEAQHWETEAMQVFGPTAPHLVRLAKYAIACGRPEVAAHFIEALKHTLHYRKTAIWLEGIKNDGHVPGLYNAFDLTGGFIPGHSPFSNILSLTPQLEYALECKPDNAVAREYLEACKLLPMYK